MIVAPQPAIPVERNARRVIQLAFFEDGKSTVACKWLFCELAGEKANDSTLRLQVCSNDSTGWKMRVAGPGRIEGGLAKRVAGVNIRAPIAQHFRVLTTASMEAVSLCSELSQARLIGMSGDRSGGETSTITG